MAAIAGKYSFVSQDKFDDWLKAVGKYHISTFFFIYHYCKLLDQKTFVIQKRRKENSKIT